MFGGVVSDFGALIFKIELGGTNGHSIPER